MAVDAFNHCSLGLSRSLLWLPLWEGLELRGRKKMRVQGLLLPIFTAGLINLYSLFHSLLEFPSFILTQCRSMQTPQPVIGDQSGWTGLRWASLLSSLTGL